MLYVPSCYLLALDQTTKKMKKVITIPAAWRLVEELTTNLHLRAKATAAAAAAAALKSLMVYIYNMCDRAPFVQQEKIF
jgi:hypothetical protein